MYYEPASATDVTIVALILIGMIALPISLFFYIKKYGKKSVFKLALVIVFVIFTWLLGGLFIYGVAEGKAFGNIYIGSYETYHNPDCPYDPNDEISISDPRSLNCVDPR